MTSIIYRTNGLNRITYNNSGRTHTIVQVNTLYALYDFIAIKYLRSKLCTRFTPRGLLLMHFCGINFSGRVCVCVWILFSFVLNVDPSPIPLINLTPAQQAVMSLRGSPMIV